MFDKYPIFDIIEVSEGWLVRRKDGKEKYNVHFYHPEVSLMQDEDSQTYSYRLVNVDDSFTACSPDLVRKHCLIHSKEDAEKVLRFAVTLEEDKKRMVE